MKLRSVLLVAFILILAQQVGAVVLKFEFNNGQTQIVSDAATSNSSGALFLKEGREWGVRAVEKVCVYTGGIKKTFDVATISTIKVHNVQERTGLIGSDANYAFPVELTFLNGKTLSGYSYFITISGKGEFGEKVSLSVGTKKKSEKLTPLLVSVNPVAVDDPTQKVCHRCDRVFDRIDYLFCPYCGKELK